MSDDEIVWDDPEMEKQRKKLGYTIQEPHSSMNQVARVMGRSTATIKRTIDQHNHEVMTVGYCSRCKRVGSPLATVVFMRPSR